MNVKEDLKDEEIDELWKSGRLEKEKLESEIKKRMGEKVFVKDFARPKYIIQVRVLDSKGRDLYQVTIERFSKKFNKPGMKIWFGLQEESLLSPGKTAHEWIGEIEERTFKKVVEKSKEFIRKLPKIEEEYDKEEEIRIKEVKKYEWIEIIGICFFLLGITVGIPVLVGIVSGWVWVLLAIGLIKGPAMIVGSGMLYLVGIAGLVYFLIRVLDPLDVFPFPGR